MKEYEGMTFQQKMDYTKEMQKNIDRNNRIANRNSNIALAFTVLSGFLLILAYLDKIVSFAHYVLSYLH